MSRLWFPLLSQRRRVIGNGVSGIVGRSRTTSFSCLLPNFLSGSVLCNGGHTPSNFSTLPKPLSEKCNHSFVKSGTFVLLPLTVDFLSRFSSYDDGLKSFTHTRTLEDCTWLSTTIHICFQLLYVRIK